MLYEQSAAVPLHDPRISTDDLQVEVSSKLLVLLQIGTIRILIQTRKTALFISCKSFSQLLNSGISLTQWRMTWQAVFSGTPHKVSSSKMCKNLWEYFLTQLSRVLKSTISSEWLKTSIWEKVAISLDAINADILQRTKPNFMICSSQSKMNLNRLHQTGQLNKLYLATSSRKYCRETTHTIVQDACRRSKQARDQDLRDCQKSSRCSCNDLLWTWSPGKERSSTTE